MTELVVKIYPSVSESLGGVLNTENNLQNTNSDDPDTKNQDPDTKPKE